MRYRIVTKTKALLLFLLVSGAMAVMLIYPSASAGGVRSGLQSAAELLIPSLFPFMALSSFVIRSGLSDRIGRILSPLTKGLFRLPSSASAAVILSFVGGFPVGARCVSLLYGSGRISSKQAEQMMTFCVCSGPAFLITGVGTLLLHNTLLGVILYLSQLLSGIIIGFVSGRIFPDKHTFLQEPEKPSVSHSGLADAFVLSCSDAAGSVISLTAMVALFASFISVCDETGLTGLVSSVMRFFGAEAPLADNALYILAEVTRACKGISEGGCPLWLFSFAVGFGGLCVHFQIFSILGGIRLGKAKFFAFRLMNAFLSSVIVYIVCRFYRPDSAVSLEIGGTVLEYSTAPAAGAFALVAMCILFLLGLGRTGRSKLCTR